MSYDAIADRKEIAYVIIKQVICLRVFLSNLLSLQFIGLFVSSELVLLLTYVVRIEMKVQATISKLTFTVPCPR